MIDLDAAKKHLRVETTDEDALIGAYLNAAIGAVQDATGKLLAPTAVTQTADGLPIFSARYGPAEAIRLWKAPVYADTAAVSVKYDDPTGLEQTLADFRLVEGANPKLLAAYGQSWPSTAIGPATVRITYTAGYADGEVPPALDQAVLLLVAHFYENRAAVVSGDRAAAVELPLAVQMLIGPYRPTGLA